MNVKRCFGPCTRDKAIGGARSASGEVLLSRQTMDTVVIFSPDANFVEIAGDALTKQGFDPFPASSQRQLASCFSGRYLNFLIDCDQPSLRKVCSVTTMIRNRAPRSFILAHCPNLSWRTHVTAAGTDAIMDGKQDLSLQIIEASTGFLENISSLVSQQLRSTRRKMKDAEIRSSIEKATARVARLSLKRMLQNDENVRAFFNNSWPASRHGQYVAIIGGKTIGFASNPKELADSIKPFMPPGNILIQKIDCENDSYRQYVT